MKSKFAYRIDRSSLIFLNPNQNSVWCWRVLRIEAGVPHRTDVVCGTRTKAEFAASYMNQCLGLTPDQVKKICGV